MLYVREEVGAPKRDFFPLAALSLLFLVFLSSLYGSQWSCARFRLREAIRQPDLGRTRSRGARRRRRLAAIAFLQVVACLPLLSHAGFASLFYLLLLVRRNGLICRSRFFSFEVSYLLRVPSRMRFWRPNISLNIFLIFIFIPSSNHENPVLFQYIVYLLSPEIRSKHSCLG